MNRRQWFVLAFCFLILGWFFIYLDLNNGFLYTIVPDELSETGNICLDSEINELGWKKNLLNKLEEGNITQQEYDLGVIQIDTLDRYDIMCLLGGEIYEPFIYLSYALWVIFMICGLLESKKKH